MKPSFSLAPLLLTLACAEGGTPSITPEPSDAGAPPATDAGTPADASTPEPPASLAADFAATELLGRPTTTSIAVSVIPSRTIEAYFEVGDTIRTPPATHGPNAPFVETFNGLTPDTAYTYRMRWRRPGDAAFQSGPDRRFHTARPAGSTFRFTVQADSHLDENSVLDLYHRTLANVAEDAPDFHIDLGDTFMTEKHSAPLTATVQAAPDEPTVVARYLYEREHFGLVAHSVPLFLVNGNHDGELGYLFKGTGADLATWATRARQSHYLNPAPDAFYSGDSTDTPHVGRRAAWYAWTWGDALFVALDPYWNTTKKAGNDPWALTLGEAQYRWLATTLASSPAKHKFLFIHNLVGGLDGQMRGGVEAAPFFEWGGKNADGSAGFDAKRPGWGKPIHQLLVENHVTAVFHGHDHLYAHQELDGVVYQEVPQPSARNTQNGATLATQYHYAAGKIDSSAGHLRVTVRPDGVTGEYVRAWLPANENGSRKNGQLSDTWTIPSR